jgi:hypothetical protein
MSTVKARFDGRVFVPESPVDLPVGYTLEIALPPQATAPQEPEGRPLAELARELDRLPANPDWPADGAVQHDHYLYGTPKKS